MNYCCQSTAATEANLRAFGGLFGCSQHPKSKPGRNNIFLEKMDIWGSTAVAVEVLLPERCCSYGSKPGWFLVPFGLFLTVENQAGPKTFFRKKKGTWGSTVVQVEVPLPEHCCSNGSKPGWFWGPFFAAFEGCNSSWAEKKTFFVKKMGDTPKLDFRGHFFNIFF